MEGISTGTFETPIFVSGKGCWLYDNEGNRYFDGTAGSGALGLGHQNDIVLEAIQNQSQRLIHTGCKLGSDIRKKLIEKLCGIVPITNAAGLLCVIGTEAVETSFKVARAYTGRKSLLSFEHGYHGKSTGALKVTWRSEFGEYSNLNKNDIYVASFPNIFEEYDDEKVLSCLRNFEYLLDQTKVKDDLPAAVILEPVQATEGVLIPGKRFLEGIIKICNRSKVLVIFDEIYTGLGRCGSMFYSNKLDVNPDILLVGKTLGGGLPISAVIGQEEVINSLPAGIQTSTFSGNPLSCAVANAILDVVVDNNFLASVNDSGNVILEFLKSLKSNFKFISTIRGEGLLIAFECIDQNGNNSPNLARAFKKEALKNGLILFGGGFNDSIIKVIPPLIINNEEMKFLLKAIEATCNIIKNKYYAIQ